MPIIDWDIEQGTAAWYAVRSGIPTASCAHLVLTPAKLQMAEARKKYAARLICERILNWQADSLDKIEHIADGKSGERFAVAQLEEIFEMTTEKVGFIRTNDRRVGASPDRVACVSADRTRIGTVVECKAPTLPIQIERLIWGNGRDYLLQVQTQLWVADADKAIFYSWTNRTPAFQAETGRDDHVIRSIADAMDRFTDELDEWTELVKRSGSFQPFHELVDPTTAAYEGDPVWSSLDFREEMTPRRSAPMETPDELSYLIDGQGMRDLGIDMGD